MNNENTGVPRGFWHLSHEIDELLERGENNPVTIMALLLELRDCAHVLWTDECNLRLGMEYLASEVTPPFDIDPNNKD